MIKEIVQFVDNLPPETFSRNVPLKEGLYMFLDIQEENGEPVLKNVDSEGNLFKNDIGFFSKKTEMNPLFEKFRFVQINSVPVSPAKIFNPNKKIFGASCSPFIVAFVKKNLIKYDKGTIEKELIDQYLKKAETYCITEYQKKRFDVFKRFLTENFYEFINGLSEFNEAKDSHLISVILKGLNEEDFLQVHEAYLSENVFNKDDYNTNMENEIFGISDSLSGFNDKKRFLKHQTSVLKYNYRVNGNVAKSLWKFFKLQQNKQLPNPCPIFVDKEEAELNKGAVKFHQNGEITSYSGLIKKLIKDYNKEELQNFYLIFFQGTKGSRIADIDFVPLFKYNITQELKLREVFPLGGKQAGQLFYTIFDLQNTVFNRVFNNQLVTKNGVWLRYFDDIEPNPKYHFTDAICNSMLQYRKAIYDYVYKAKYESITCRMFDEMMKTSILEDIRTDEEFQRGFTIKEKLNIWFSLYNYFSQNKNRENMANKTVELQEAMQTLINDETAHIAKDDQFAFAAGQIIWKLLIQSKSANRSHALLEPFLQKTNVEQFKLAIAKTFDMYKHEFTLYPKKYGFDKLMSEVMGYEPNEQNMKKLLIYILAGYFSESMI